MSRLEDKVALVTGAGQGIGRAAAVAFAQEGARVLVNDVSADAVDKVVAEIRALPNGYAEPAVGAIGSPGVAEDLVEKAIQRFDGLHILLNNAAVSANMSILEPDPDLIDRTLRINLHGPILLTAEAVRRVMAPARYGKIINITSRSGLRGKPGESVYSAAKAGLAGLTLAWAQELSAYRINVNAVAPAAWTALLDEMPEPMKSVTIQRRTDNVLQRVAQPEDVTPTLVFLASDASEYLTGQILQATGQSASML